MAPETLKEVVIEPDAPAAPDLPTSSELIEQGVDPREVEMVKKHGLTSDKPEKKEKAEPAVKAEFEPHEKEEAPAPAVKKPDEKKPAAESDIFEEMPELFEDMTPEDIDKERARVKTFNQNEIGLYAELKRIRKRAQDAEGDRDYYELQIKKLNEKIEKIGKPEAPPAKAKKNEDDDILDILGDEKKDEEQDPDKKFLTKADLEKIEADKAAKFEEQRKIAQEHTDALDRMEVFAKDKYPNFEEASDQAMDVLSNAKKYFKDQPRMIQKIGLLYAQYFQLASAAHKIKLDKNTLNAADIVMEISEFHPNYKKPDGAGKPNADAGGDRNPEKVNKMLENAKRRSSASVTGGNSTRVVSVDDLTIAQINALPQAEFRRLPRHVREKALGKPSRP